VIYVIDIRTCNAEESNILKQLDPVKAANYKKDRSCMEGTRTAILNEIVAWAATPFDPATQLDDSTSNVFWLYGMPGLGKTSVANSLCDRLRGSGNLGGSFFCKHDEEDLRESKRVLSTLIAKLVQMWGPFRKLVAKTLVDEPQIDAQSTSGELLLNPLKALKKHPPHPLILVIDALDECQSTGRIPLLKSLTKACSSVHWLKIVVISRPERDIKSFFNEHQIIGRDLADDESASKDIRIFTKDRMALVASQQDLAPDWPGKECVDKIVERADGLFQFVETLYHLVNVPEPEPLLGRVLGGESQGANTTLHDLYSMVITTRISKPTQLFHSILRAIVAVSAHRPLCDETLAQLLGIEPRVVRSWVNELSSLLSRDDSKKGGIHFRHLSILEFLVGSSCPAEFRVNIKLANSELTRYCLRTMKNELQFNICGLETSCLSNKDILGLNNRVEQSIPDTLQYSCVHWSSHLCYDNDPVGAEITGLLDDFFAESRPLYWIEVLSLMGKSPVAISSMRLMKRCFQVCILTLYTDTN
jgi:NACHT domain